MKQMSRREARIKAYELIFMINTCEDINFEFMRLDDELKDHKKHLKYIKDVVSTTYDNITEIDNCIETNLDESWSLNRLSKMCLAALRLSVAEILYIDEIPESVSINEAVEIAKIFGDDNDSLFVNGVLGKIVK